MGYASYPAYGRAYGSFIGRRYGELSGTPCIYGNYAGGVGRYAVTRGCECSTHFTSEGCHRGLSNSETNVGVAGRRLHGGSNVISPLVRRKRSPCRVVAGRPRLSVSIHSLCACLSRNLFATEGVSLGHGPNFGPQGYRGARVAGEAIFRGELFDSFDRLRLSSFMRVSAMRSSERSGGALLAFFFAGRGLFLTFLLGHYAGNTIQLVFSHLRGHVNACRFLSIFRCVLASENSRFKSPITLRAKLSRVRHADVCCYSPVHDKRGKNLRRTRAVLHVILPGKADFRFLAR